MATTSYWLKTAAPVVVEALHDLPDKVDVMVIGAGYAGLTVASTLAEYGADVVVCDQYGVGGGASARNGGIVGPGPTGTYRAAIERDGREITRFLTAISYEAMAFLRELKERSPIDLQLRLSGRAVLAATEEEYADLKESQYLLEQDGWPVEWLNHALLPPALKSLYLGGLLLPGGSVHSGQFTMALAHRAMQHGVRIMAPARVEALDRNGERPVVIIEGRRVTADTVVVATNGWTARLLPHVPITPQRGQVLVTEPVAACLPYAIGARSGFDYYHQRSDGALVIGGHRDWDLVAEATAEDGLNPTIQNGLVALVKDIVGHPVPINAQWSGTMGFTPDVRPIVGEISHRVHIIAGFNGHGVVVAPILGERLGKAIARGSGDPDLTPFDPHRFGTLAK